MQATGLTGCAWNGNASFSSVSVAGAFALPATPGQRSRLTAFGAAAAGGLAIVIVAYSLPQTYDIVAGWQARGVPARVGLGEWIALVGGIVAIIATLLLFRDRRHTTVAVHVAGRSPLG